MSPLNSSLLILPFGTSPEDEEEERQNAIGVADMFATPVNAGDQLASAQAFGEPEQAGSPFVEEPLEDLQIGGMGSGVAQATAFGQNAGFLQPAQAQAFAEPDTDFSGLFSAPNVGDDFASGYATGLGAGGVQDTYDAAALMEPTDPLFRDDAVLDPSQVDPRYAAANPDPSGFLANSQPLTAQSSRATASATGQVSPRGQDLTPRPQAADYEADPAAAAELQRYLESAPNHEAAENLLDHYLTSREAKTTDDALSEIAAISGETRTGNLSKPRGTQDFVARNLDKIPGMTPGAADLIASFVSVDNPEDWALAFAPGVGDAWDIARLGASLGSRGIRSFDDLTRAVGRALTPEEAQGARSFFAGGGVTHAPTPPTPAATPSGPPPREMPLSEPGDIGIRTALATKEETLLTPGAIFGEEGSARRAVAGVLNPSVDMPRNVNVAYNARTAVQATETTDAIRRELPAARNLDRAFRAERPAYIGPEDNPFKNTAFDYAQNPRFYQASPNLAVLKDNLGRAQLETVNIGRERYGLEVGKFEPSDPDGIYLSNIKRAEDAEKAIASTSQSLTSRGSVAKPRAYDSAYDRWKADTAAGRTPFMAETNLEAIVGHHANALAYMDANNTFKGGVPGKTLTEVVEETHPGLLDRRNTAAQKLQNLQGVIDRGDATARSQQSALDPLIKEQDAIQERLTPRIVAITEADQVIPEISRMQQQVRELFIRARSIDKAVTSAQGRQQAAMLRMSAAGVEAAKLEAELAELRRAVETANIGDYVRNQKTFRYHLPEEDAAINTVLKTRVDNAFIEGILQAADEGRVFALGPDLSPLTIQGSLGAASHPEVLIFDGAGIAKAAAAGDNLWQNIAPEDLRRFEFATGRRLSAGAPNPEFRTQGRGLERLANTPGGAATAPLRATGRIIAGFNNALQNTVDYGTFKAWKNDSDLLRKLNPGMSQNVADAEAANSIGTMVPRLDMVATGRSQQRSRLERFAALSPSFVGAPFKLAKDYGSAVAKLGAAPVRGKFNPVDAWHTLSGREQLALIRGTAMLGTFSSASIASALLSADANGLSPTEAIKEVLDPASGRFMSIIVGGEGSVGLGGPFRSAAKMAYNTAGYAPGTPWEGRSPVSWLSFKVNPSVRTTAQFGADVAQGQNVVEALTYGLESLNLLAATYFDPQNRSSGNKVVDVLAGALGTNYWERTAFETLAKGRKEAMSELTANGTLPPELQGTDYYSLGGKERDDVDRWIQENRPGLVEQYEADRRKRGSIYQVTADSARLARAGEGAKIDPKTGEITGGEYNTILDQNLNGLLRAAPDAETAQKIAESVTDTRNRQSAAAAAIYSNPEFQKAVATLPETDINRLVSEWYQVYDSARNPNTGLIDWDLVDAVHNDMVADLNTKDPAMVNRLLYNVASDVTDEHPAIQMVKGASSTLGDAGYYEMDTAGKDEYLRQNPDANVASWLVGDLGLRSAAAAEIALGLGTARQDIKLTGDKTIITSENLPAFKRQDDLIEQFKGEIDYLDGIDTTTDRNARTRARQSDPVLDYLYYLLSATPGDDGAIVVQNVDAVNRLIAQYGLRMDGVRPRASR